MEVEVLWMVSELQTAGVEAEMDALGVCSDLESQRKEKRRTEGAGV